MTQAMTVRLDDSTRHKLDDLARWYSLTKSAAVKDAIARAWDLGRAQALDAAYAAAVADDPNYPYDSPEEAATLRKRRNRRQAEAEAR